jgi:hypothetical protein
VKTRALERTGPRLTAVEIGRVTETNIALLIASTPSTLLGYPSPLSTGDLARLRLPRGLTARDAERLGASARSIGAEC